MKYYLSKSIPGSSTENVAEWQG